MTSSLRMKMSQKHKRTIRGECRWPVHCWGRFLLFATTRGWSGPSSVSRRAPREGQPLGGTLPMAPFSWAFVLLAFGGGGLPGRPSSLSDHRSGVGFLRSSLGVGFARADAETEEGDEYPDLTGGRKCSNHKATRCLKEYEDCLLFSGPAQWQPKLCECQEQYYGVCLRGAGCAADKMLECIEMQIESACDDMSICGSNCGRHENNFVRDSQVGGAVPPTAACLVGHRVHCPGGAVPPEHLHRARLLMGLVSGSLSFFLSFFLRSCSR